MKKITFFFILLSSVLNSQNVYTYAGNGNAGYSGDGGPANNATFYNLMGLACDAAGNLYIADANNARMRKVNTSGIISTYAGNGTGGDSGDGGQATQAQITGPFCIATDPAGNIYFTEQYYVRKISAAGIITTIAGNGTYGYSGDGGPAISAQVRYPDGIAIDVTGNVYFADNYTCIRKINTAGIISTIAGNDTAGFAGDGGPALFAKLNNPKSIFIDNTNGILICDAANRRIRKINSSGIITTIAGTGNQGLGGDGGPAILADFASPQGICADNANNIYIAEYYNSYIRKINSAGIITKFAGTGTSLGFSGDGGPALSAQFNSIHRLAIDNLGNIYVSDLNNNRVRVICQSSCLAGIKQNKENENSILILPNPNNGAFKITVDEEIKNGELILVNSLGQCIYKQQIIQGINEINIIAPAKGLYNYFLQDNNQVIAVGKLSIE